MDGCAGDAAQRLWCTSFRLVASGSLKGALHFKGEVHFITEVRPPNLLQLSVLAPLADSYDPSIPLPLMKGLIAVLGGIGRLLGYQESYPQYSKAGGMDRS